jgi:hypothetical protein
MMGEQQRTESLFYYFRLEDQISTIFPHRFLTMCKPRFE